MAAHQSFVPKLCASVHAHPFFSSQRCSSWATGKSSQLPMKSSSKTTRGHNAELVSLECVENKFVSSVQDWHT
eukprot:1032472-Pleurochrysis_carterae.AAC.1